MTHPIRTALLCTLLTGITTHTLAQEKVLNLYSARHYQTDEQLYETFTQKTGIKINRIEAQDEPLLERLKSEGKNSPADVLLLADASRLWKASVEGLFTPNPSKILATRIPAQLKDKDNLWFGFSSRARVIVYNKANIQPNDVTTYESLANPKLKGQVCTRSGSHPYMLSLVGAMIEHHGEAATQTWAQGMVANMARTPKGGDTDQIKAVAAGECGVALTNTYYYVRLLRSNKPEDQAIIDKIGFVWPNQATWGTHMNIAGGGILKNAPHKEAAAQFLDYLASDTAQQYFANGNNEWPIVKDMKTQNAALDGLGKFKADTLTVNTLGINQIKAQRILDKVNYQ